MAFPQLLRRRATHREDRGEGAVRILRRHHPLLPLLTTSMVELLAQLAVAEDALSSRRRFESTFVGRSKRLSVGAYRERYVRESLREVCGLDVGPLVEPRAARQAAEQQPTCRGVRQRWLYAAGGSCAAWWLEPGLALRELHADRDAGLGSGS